MVYTIYIILHYIYIHNSCVGNQVAEEDPAGHEEPRAARAKVEVSIPSWQPKLL